MWVVKFLPVVGQNRSDSGIIACCPWCYKVITCVGDTGNPRFVVHTHNIHLTLSPSASSKKTFVKFNIQCVLLNFSGAGDYRILWRKIKGFRCIWYVRTLSGTIRNLHRRNFLGYFYFTKLHTEGRVINTMCRELSTELQSVPWHVFLWGCGWLN